MTITSNGYFRIFSWLFAVDRNGDFLLNIKFGFGQLVKLFPDTQKTSFFSIYVPGAVEAATAAVPGSPPPPPPPVSPTMPRLFLLWESISEIAKCSKVSKKKKALLSLASISLFPLLFFWLCLSPLPFSFAVTSSPNGQIKDAQHWR